MTPPEAPAPARGRWWQLPLGVLVSAALVWWAFRDMEWRESWGVITSAHPGWMVLAVVLATLPFPLRLPRWRLLLRHEDGGAVATAPLWHALAIGFAANNVLPFRAGEVLRVAAIARLGRVPFVAALSSVAVERVLDALVAVGLLSIGLVTLDATGPAAALAAKARLVGALGLVALAVAVVAAWRREAALRLARRMLPANRVGDAVYQLGDRVLQGLAALSDPGTAVRVVGWSLAVWLCNAAAFYAAFHAFDFPIGFGGALVVQGALLVGITLPTTPGYAGVFEAVIAATLATFFGIPMAAGLAYGLLYHVTTFIPITLLGAWSAVTSGFRRAEAAA